MSDCSFSSTWHFACLIFFAGTMAISQQVTATVREVAPEALPPSTCTESKSGYLGVEKNGVEINTLSPEQIGEYIVKRISDGYVVELYPQVSGRIFAIATCPKTEPTSFPKH